MNKHSKKLLISVWLLACGVASDMMAVRPTLSTVKNNLTSAVSSNASLEEVEKYVLWLREHGCTDYKPYLETAIKSSGNLSVIKYFTTNGVEVTSKMLIAATQAKYDAAQNANVLRNKEEQLDPFYQAQCHRTTDAWDLEERYDNIIKFLERRASAKTVNKSLEARNQIRAQYLNKK
jgi:hypothetical protein